ncbi:MAG: class I SAM-dependent methyltransferase [Bacillota bacterium]
MAARMMIELPARLQAVADYIPPGKTVADIGTDHALLPVYLVGWGVAPRVIAVEKAPGPLDAARQAVAASDLGEFIDVRAGDGLAPVAPGEAEVVVLAGMGGRNIAAILGASPEVLGTVETLVLQPQEPVTPARRWLIENGFRIAAETLVPDAGRLYPVIWAEKGRSEPVDDLLLEVGPDLVARKHPFLPRYLAVIRARYEKMLDGLEKSGREELDQRRAAAGARLEQLEALEKCL